MTVSLIIFSSLMLTVLNRWCIAVILRFKTRKIASKSRIKKNWKDSSKINKISGGHYLKILYNGFSVFIVSIFYFSLLLSATTIILSIMPFDQYMIIIRYVSTIHFFVHIIVLSIGIRMSKNYKRELKKRQR